MKKMTVGFVFTPDFEKVLLMHKNRPDWQKGFVNGVGGKFEEGETGLQCIVREVQEETNLETTEEDWIYAGEIHGIRESGQEWKVEFYGTIYNDDPTHAESTTDEKVEWFDRKNLPDNVWNNLPWLIELTYDKMNKDMFKEFSVEYKDGVQ